jgi:hypothetical protein
VPFSWESRDTGLGPRALGIVAYTITRNEGSEGNDWLVMAQCNSIILYTGQMVHNSGQR